MLLVIRDRTILAADLGGTDNRIPALANVRLILGHSHATNYRHVSRLHNVTGYRPWLRTVDRDAVSEAELHNVCAGLYDSPCLAHLPNQMPTFLWHLLY